MLCNPFFQTLGKSSLSSIAKGHALNTVSEGTGGTQSWRLFLRRDSEKISFWNDISLFAPGSIDSTPVYHFVTEIPKGTNAKMEVALDEPFHPIKQDIKKGELRFLKYGEVLYNYGFFPQTWEDPNHKPDGLDYPGDGDPLDVIDLSPKPAQRGEIRRVKPLGCFALIDEGEADFKILTIDIEDPLATKINGLEDIEHYLPGALDRIRGWYKYYKTADGKGENRYGFDENPQSKEYTIKIINDCHQLWAKHVTANQKTKN